ncbi:DUF3558 domain-containing protein [Streptomyces sp. PT12]|uniref:DUF3558 domain-containing protein n=1 Tax=Streptomyces sp. PT12 TaxID=1510197 RepID=UPI000DE1E1FE|nr:DUF3558 domain-containing protein [Streptomyces sp. PT12]RBM17896.1 hypothetical protein DEH69_14595 [Streptomyces sp. PT12]
MRLGTIARGLAPVAAALVGLGALGACSGDLSGEDDPSVNPGSGTAGSAQPGRYSGLPEPCGAVGDDTLRELLPGGDPEVYAGEPMVTYDTGRRVGCSWHLGAETGTHQLSVDLQRVISYDPGVSDDDQAELDFEERADEAGVPVGGADGGSAPPSDDPFAPRPLDGIGDVAFIDDRLTSTNPGERRAVTLAFRNANVLVTVQYTVSTTVADEDLDSGSLQQRAQTVARQLAEGFDS